MARWRGGVTFRRESLTGLDGRASSRGLLAQIPPGAVDFDRLDGQNCARPHHASHRRLPIGAPVESPRCIYAVVVRSRQLAPRSSVTRPPPVSSNRRWSARCRHGAPPDGGAGRGAAGVNGLRRRGLQTAGGTHVQFPSLHCRGRHHRRMCQRGVGSGAAEGDDPCERGNRRESEGNRIPASPQSMRTGASSRSSQSASNLVAGDTNGQSDVFVRDRNTGATTRVSVATNGTQANSGSYQPAISADGRYVAFYSNASNLGARGHQLLRGHLRARPRHGHDDAGERGDQRHPGGRVLRPAVDQRGRAVRGVFLERYQPGHGRHQRPVGRLRPRPNDRGHDARERGDQRQSGKRQVLRATPSAGTGRPSCSVSSASNLVDGDTNGAFDVFVHDRTPGITTRVSVATRRHSGKCRVPLGLLRSARTGGSSCSSQTQATW